MSKKRRTWTPEEKATIVLEILREENTLAEIAKKHEVSQQLLSRWKTEFIANMSAVFNKKNEDVDKLKQEHEDEKELLVKKIGELTLDVDWLKKKQIQIFIKIYNLNNFIILFMLFREEIKHPITYMKEKYLYIFLHFFLFVLFLLIYYLIFHGHRRF